jgi:hypothetical protein
MYRVDAVLTGFSVFHAFALVAPFGRFLQTPRPQEQHQLSYTSTRG